MFSLAAQISVRTHHDMSKRKLEKESDCSVRRCHPFRLMRNCREREAEAELRAPSFCDGCLFLLCMHVSMCVLICSQVKHSPNTHENMPLM